MCLLFLGDGCPRARPSWAGSKAGVGCPSVAGLVLMVPPVKVVVEENDAS